MQQFQRDEHALRHVDSGRGLRPGLFLGTQGDNVADMIAKGRKAQIRVRRGQEVASCRLTADQALEVVRSPLSNRDCARTYGVTPAAIYNIRRGRSWSHVTGVARG
nr:MULTISPECIES: hypothetical protein [unclassified Methylobacterium]